MPDSDEPVKGDGKISLPHDGEKEDDPMAVDLPETLGVQLLHEGAANIQHDNRNGRASATGAMAILHYAAARNFDELGAVESRATSGVIATPIASPTTQAPGA